MPDINIVLKGTDQASPALNKVEKEVKDLGSTAKTASGPSGLGGLGNVFKAGLTTALVGTAAAVGGLVFAFKDSLGAAREAAQGQKQLAAVLTSTGFAAGVTVDAANELAGSLAKVTNFQDDTILAGESMLLTFTNIGKDVFPRATETILDMSQALGQDLKSSAVQLGKALNDPIAGVSALSRVGVTFTETQKDMIKSMVAAGDVAGAQALILDELGKEFGGSARALADPVTQLSNAWGEVQETVGNFILPLLADLAKNALPYVQSAMDALGGGLDAFNTNLDEGGGYLSAFTAAVRAMLPTDMQAKFDELTGIIAGTFNTIVGTVQTQMAWARLAWDTNWAGMKTTWENFKADTTKSHEEFWDEWNQTFHGDGGTKGSLNDWEKFLQSVSESAAESWLLIENSATQFLRILRGISQASYGLMEGDWGKMWSNISLALDAFTNIILNDIQYVFGAGIRNAFASALNGVWDTLHSWWSNIVSWWNSTIGSLPGIGALPGVPAIPNLGIVNPNNTGGQSATGIHGSSLSTTTNNTPVTINQHFYGQTDRTTVKDASEDGVLRASRSMGLR